MAKLCTVWPFAEIKDFRISKNLDFSISDEHGVKREQAIDKLQNLSNQHTNFVQSLCQFSAKTLPFAILELLP